MSSKSVLTDSQYREMLVAERTELYEFLCTLNNEQWVAQSLCGEWRVADVVGHVVFLAESGPSTIAVKAILGAFRIDRMLSSEAKKLGELPMSELLRRLKAAIPNTSVPPSGSSKSMLGDTLVHHQDIRRPLGLPRSIPADRLNAVLDHLATSGPPVNGKKRTVGLRFVAIDTKWTYGSGPGVSGLGESLLMAFAGRVEAITDLMGEGMGPFVARFVE